MKMNKRIFMLLIVITVLSQAYDCNDEMTRKLSRKRRYLVFPTGSSFQLVYDQIIPIVDYTNLLIFGVTTALAWELPDKPISKSQLMEIYENGTLPLLRRNDTVDTIDTTTTKPVQNFKNRPLDSYYNNRNEYAGNSYYNSAGGGNNDISYDPVYFNNKPNYKPNRYSDDNTLEQINYYSGKKYKPWKSSQWTKEKQRKPYIYSGVVKRSVPDSNESPEKQFFIDHHKASRHQLYDTIVKYLIAHGINGKECVRKALCETYQKRNETEPGSFIGEIMRVIFSLPQSNGLRTNNANQIYEESHFTQENCNELYPNCKESIWQSDFIH